MVKQRMTALDVRASVEEMQAELHGLRLTNIYDIPPRTFLFKFGNSEKKRTLLVENGVRLHLTQLVREKPKVPTQFTLRLRKHVRAWRLDSVTQLQHDRTVDFRFGTGESASYHIIVELFSKGNIVLTDHEYRILLLLRTRRDDGVNMFVRELYPVTKSFEQQQVEDQQRSEMSQCIEALRQEWNTVFARHAEHDTTRLTLSATHHFGPSLADHILAVTRVKNVKKGDMTCSADEMFELLLPGMLEAWDIALSPLPKGGYLISKITASKGQDSKGQGSPPPYVNMVEGLQPDGVQTDDKPARPVSSHPQGKQYDDFSPVLLAQYRETTVSTSYIPSFGSVCDSFFLYTEGVKIEQHNEKAATCVLSKKERFERDHKRRIEALERSEEENTRKGELIIQNAARIDEAVGLINGALAAGIQWEALRRLLKQRQSEGHPVACMVDELFLDRNSISILVEANDGDDNYCDEDDEGRVGTVDDGRRIGSNDIRAKESDESCDRTPFVIEIDLSKTAYANAAAYFTRKKANHMKLERTIAATAKAAAGAEKKGERLAAKKQTKKAITTGRNRCWWEKFNWFRTSCGDLVLQGHDMQSTELLVRRVMRLGDVFVHSDVGGALPCVLRTAGAAWSTAAVLGQPITEGGVTKEDNCARAWPIHAVSLDEAAAWCICRSSAWESKFSVGAWWVYASQIVGGSAEGCYLFSGEKNYVRPQPLMLGCGLLFRVSSRAVDPRDQQELPNFVAEGSRAGQNNSWTEGGDICEVVKHDDSTFLECDTATALQPMPPSQANRQRRQHGQSPQCCAVDGRITKGAEPPAVSTLRTFGASPSVYRVADGNAIEEPTVARPKGHQLTKHQRKKLKKIQQKYKDQDDEDRLNGAILNGNKLSRVQLDLLAAQRVKNNNKVARSHSQCSFSTINETRGCHSGEVWDDKRLELVHRQGPPHDREGSCPPRDCCSVVGDDKPDCGRPRHLGIKQHDHTHQWESCADRSSAASLEAVRAANDAEFNREWVHLTSRPQATDCVEYAIAVCAPLSSIVSYKYRSELSHGTAKKGQVALSLVEYFVAASLNTENTTELRALQSLEMNEMIGQLRGNLKKVNLRHRK